MLIGGALVILFMLIYYKGSGIIANTALLVNIVLIAGGLGALAYALRGFGRHHGLGDYDDSWSWWYVFKTPITSSRSTATSSREF